MMFDVRVHMHNEPVEKVTQRSYWMIFGGHLILNNHEIVDCDAFCEVILFWVSSKNLFGYFFYSLNDLYNLRGQSAMPKTRRGYSASGRCSGYAVTHHSSVLSRDFHDSGSLLKCMIATMSKVSSLIW